MGHSIMSTRGSLSRRSKDSRFKYSGPTRHTFGFNCDGTLGDLFLLKWKPEGRCRYPPTWEPRDNLDENTQRIVRPHQGPTLYYSSTEVDEESDESDEDSLFVSTSSRTDYSRGKSTRR